MYPPFWIVKSDKNVAYHKSVYVADQKSLLSKARSTSKAAAIWKPIVFTLTLRPANIKQTDPSDVHHCVLEQSKYMVAVPISTVIRHRKESDLN